MKLSDPDSATAWSAEAMKDSQAVSSDPIISCEVQPLYPSQTRCHYLKIIILPKPTSCLLTLYKGPSTTMKTLPQRPLLLHIIHLPPPAVLYRIDAFQTPKLCAIDVIRHSEQQLRMVAVQCDMMPNETPVLHDLLSLDNHRFVHDYSGDLTETIGAQKLCYRVYKRCIRD